MRKLLLSLCLIGVFISYGATCTISGTVSASSSTCSSIGTGDTMLITGTLNLNSDYTVHASNDIVVIVDGGSIVWNGNYGFDLGSGGSLFLVNSGALVNGSGSCNATKVISFGGTDLASCNGGGASYSFADIVTAGGINSGGPVPVSLLNFTYSTENSLIKIAWSTASEINHERFELLRSYNGHDFQVIHSEFSTGNSHSVKEYNYLDKPNGTAEVYYKLIQYDFDGKTNTFNILKVKLSDEIASILPNPFNNFLNIELLDTDDHTVSIYDAKGKLVLSKETNSEENITINTSELTTGIYFVNLGSYYYKLVKE
ncbi:MAG: T9SS type A sorting domain-containing protein [Bacteroidia bacterium]|nr:T9SS type A sorting domain-containing protein [Bacteroidia bacterium]